MPGSSATTTHEAAVRPGERGAHERVGGHVQADVLHRDQGPLAGERGAEGLLEGRLLVHRPGRPVNFAPPPEIRIRYSMISEAGVPGYE